MKQVLQTFLALLVVIASQKCVAERVHFHHRQPVQHHHHLDHGFGAHSDEHDHAADRSEEVACFQQLTAAITKFEIQVRVLYVVVPAATHAFAAWTDEDSLMTVRTANPPPRNRRDSVYRSSQYYLATRSPNAPPFSLS